MAVVSVLPLSICVAVIVVSFSLALGVLDVAEVGVETFEALLPVPPVEADPIGDVPEWSRPKPARAPLCLPALLDEAGPFQHPQVLRDRGLAHVERLREVLHGCLPCREAGEDRPTRRVGEGGERRAESVRLRHRPSLLGYIT